MGVAGLNFIWDSSQEPGSRIVSVRMWKDNTELDLSKTYYVTLKYFVAVGKDGYTCFLDPSVQMVTELENVRLLQDIVFGALEQLGAQETAGHNTNDMPKLTKQKSAGQQMKELQIRKRLELFNTNE